VKVAVVVPVLNGRDKVRECVTACLAQTRPPDELFVIDNGSTDHTADVARAAGATVICEPVRSSFRARNRGWEAASADVIAFTDVDCVPRPNWLADLTEPFVDPSVAAVGGDIIQAELTSAAQRWMVERRFLDQGFNQCAWFLPYFATANAAYRRSTLEAIGGFDEAYVVSGGDTDLTWRVQELAGGRVVYRPEAAVDHFVGTGVHEITGRWHRYSAGTVVLERRWSDWPGFPVRPRFFARTASVWRLPFALANRARTRRPLSVPLIDAAVAVSTETGRVRGHVDAWRRAVTPLDPTSRLGAASRAHSSRETNDRPEPSTH
jgi:GT2 family glycosyltransferase